MPPPEAASNDGFFESGQHGSAPGEADYRSVSGNETCVLLGQFGNLTANLSRIETSSN